MPLESTSGFEARVHFATLMTALFTRCELHKKLIRPHARHMAHLAPLARFLLAVKVQMRLAILAQYRVRAQRLGPHDIAHFDAREARAGRSQRQAADRADVAFELAGCTPLVRPLDRIG